MPRLRQILLWIWDLRALWITGDRNYRMRSPNEGVITMGPLFQPLDDAVMILSDRLLPSGFDTTDNEGLVNTADKLQRIWDATDRLLIWTGFSDRTVYGSPRINHTARAWHDYCHVTGPYPLDHTGETAALSVQKAMVRQMKLWDGDRICQLLDSEVIGQVECYYRTGEFPDDQRAFTRWFIGRR